MKAVFFILLFFGYTAASFAGSPETVRLRLRWGGIESSAFGEVHCESGSMSALSPISMDPDCPGGAWLVNGSVQIRQSVTKKYNGFDVTVPYLPNANLLVQLGPEADYSSAVRFAIPLREIIRSGKTASLAEDSKFQFSVSRVPGDDLRIQMDRDNLVFAPRDMFQCTVTPALCWEEPVRAGHKKDSAPKNETIPQAKEIGELEFSVYRGRETFSVHSGTVQNVHLDGTMPAQIHFPVPENEGVYDVILKLRRKTGGKNLLQTLGNTFSGRDANEEILAERRIQFLVLNDTVISFSDSGNYALKMEIDPSVPQWWKSLDPDVLRQFGSWFPNAASLQNRNRRILAGEKQNFMELPQGPLPDTDPAWEAFPLIVESPWMPHILEIEYPANMEQTYSLSILEPNAAGAIEPPGIDSGINVPPQIGITAQTPIRLDRHHILFWPQSKTPILLMVNRHAQNSAYIGKIRLYHAGSHFAPQKSIQTASGTQAPQTVPDRVSKRLVALLISKPMFSQTFSATEMNNETTGQCISDWLTFYEGGKRLIEYMRHVGFNGLVLSVYSDGSTIYPSRILNPTPRYDNGTYFPTAQDPVRKDITEMLFRMFDRENLKLIPSMDFSSPISSLETAVYFPNAAEVSSLGTPASPLRWVNHRGRELITQRKSLKHGAPYYNILNPTVQETVLRSIAEVVRRYGHHPSFGGLSLQLHSDSFLVLPNPQWGMDPDSIASFIQDTGMTVPEDYMTRVRFLTSGPGAKQWIQWRAARMTIFYRRAAALLSTIPNAKLYLNGMKLFCLNAHPELMPRLDGILSAEEVFLYFGLDMEQLKLVPNLVVSRPQEILTNKPLTKQAGDLQWQQTPGTYRMFQDQKEPTSLFHHPADLLRLTSFDSASPFKPTFTWMATTYAQTTPEARRPYAESLAMLDAFTIMEGGWNPVFGKEEALRETISILSQLPAVHFNSAMNTTSETPHSASRIVIFRSCSQHGTNYAYAVNTTPFTAIGKVYVQQAADSQDVTASSISALYLKDGSGVTLQRDTRGLFWQVQLAPYQIEAIQFTGSPIMLLDPVSKTLQDTRELFRQEYSRLLVSLENLKKPVYYLGLKNPGFEQPLGENGEMPYWTVSYPQRQNPGLAQMAFGASGTTLNGTSPNGTFSGGTPTAAGSTGAASWENPANSALNGTERLPGTALPSDLLSSSISSSGATVRMAGPNSGAGPSSAGMETDPANRHASADLGAQNVIFGTSALQLKSTGTPIRVMSHPFELNATGRLTVYVWLRTDQNTTSIPLRFVVRGEAPSGKFYRTANLSAPQTGIGSEWKRLNIPVNDLPLEKGTQLSLGFELYGAGSVWLDNIQLSDIDFSPAEIAQIQRIFTQLGNRIECGDIAPCINALECYWLRFLSENAGSDLPPHAEPIAELAMEHSPAAGTPEKTSEGIQELPDKKNPKLPHLGQLPKLPKFPTKSSEDPQKELDSKVIESQQEKKPTYLDKIKGLLPW